MAASTRHFVSDPLQCVNSALHAITLTNPYVFLDAKNKILYRKPGYTSQVSLVSGGGSGHEPSFSAFVGPGLLSACVAGTIFASPNSAQIYHALRKKVDVSKGLLVIVMNYTGDVLNFGLAMEKAKSGGLNVRMVIVGDDVGVGRAKGGKVGRRGIAGTILVQKIAGALAAKGASLEEVEAKAQQAAQNTVSIGTSLAHVHVPGQEIHGDAEDEELSQDKAEIGMGIHNEVGCERVKLNLPGLVEDMCSKLLSQKDSDRAYISFESKDKFVLLVNNLGGVSGLEMGAITSEVCLHLDSKYGIQPARIFSGIYMTSLNGLGFSISLLKIFDEDILDLLDASVEVSGWTPAVVSNEVRNQSSTIAPEDETDGEIKLKPSGLSMDPAQTENTLKAGLKRLIKAEPEITRYDTVMGDGDCGTGMKRGAESILEFLSRGELPSDAASLTVEISRVVEDSMDGTSGALYAIFLNALANSLSTSSTWAKALVSASSTLSQYTPARPGDRTLVDALHPFIDTFERTGKLEEAAKAARMGAEGTKGMKTSLGRSTYVGGDGYLKVPDAGAWALSEFLFGLSDASK